MTVKVEFSSNTVELEVKYLYNHLNAAAICLRTSISTLEPITGRKSETAIPRIIVHQHLTLNSPLNFLRFLLV